MSKGYSTNPQFSPEQQAILGKFLLEYAVWYMKNRETLEQDSALGASVPQETPLEERIQILYGDATL